MQSLPWRSQTTDAQKGPCKVKPHWLFSSGYGSIRTGSSSRRSGYLSDTGTERMNRFSALVLGPSWNGNGQGWQPLNILQPSTYSQRSGRSTLRRCRQVMVNFQVTVSRSTCFKTRILLFPIGCYNDYPQGGKGGR